jgi:hypothetical protein
MLLRKTVAIYPNMKTVCKTIRFSMRKMKRFSISHPVVRIGTYGTQRDHKIHNCLDKEEEVRQPVNNFCCTSDNMQATNKISDVVLYRP